MTTSKLISILSRPWVNLIALLLERLFAVGGFLALCIGIASVSTYNDRYSYWRMLLIPVFGYLTTAIHELGHFIGARWAKMLVISARIGVVELYPRRGFWKVRICRPRIRTDASGYLFVIPDFSRSIRAQHIICTLGGPLANFIAATILWAISMTYWSDAYAPALVGFAALNGLVGLANLMPNARGATDGYQLIQFIARDDTDDSLRAYPRLIWRSYIGTAAQNLPESDLRALEQQPTPAPVFRKWYALKAAQNTGNWTEAVAVADAIESEVATFDAHLIAHFLALLDLIRIERAFSESIQSMQSLRLPESIFATVGWYSPYLKPRCEALNAAIAGDANTCERLLNQSQREADRSLDMAVHESERRIRNAIRKVLQAPSQQASASPMI